MLEDGCKRVLDIASLLKKKIPHEMLHVATGHVALITFVAFGCNRNTLKQQLLPNRR